MANVLDCDIVAIGSNTSRAILFILWQIAFEKIQNFLFFTEMGYIASLLFFKRKDETNTTSIWSLKKKQFQL